jgi:hypothetical protein
LLKNIFLDNEYGVMELQEGIIIASWKASFIDIDIAQKVVNSRLKATDGNKYPILIKLDSVKGSTKEARDFLASSKGSEGLTAGALLVNSVLGNVIASLFLYLNRPLIPTKIFKDEAKAMEWLAEFVEKK